MRQDLFLVGTLCGPTVFSRLSHVSICQILASTVVLSFIDNFVIKNCVVFSLLGFNFYDAHDKLW